MSVHDRLTKALTAAEKEPVKISEQAVKDYLLYLGVNEEALEEKTGVMHGKIKKYVSAKYQRELNEFLLMGYKTSNTDLGVLLGNYMGFYSGNFLEALVSFAILED